MDTKKILIIDDELNFLKMLKLNLEDIGKYSVKVLSGATDMMKLLREFEPDVILLDILMPRINGFDACRTLKADPATKDIPVIILSALDKDSDIKQAYDLGAEEYLSKPVDVEEVVAAVERVVGE